MEYTKRLSYDDIKKYNDIMDGDLSSEYFIAYLKGQKYFNVGIMLIDKWEKDLMEYNKEINALTDTARNNNKGIGYEKKGMIQEAISTYEENIEIGYPALHSYERLIILYRKEKRYNDEIRIIEKAINDFPLKTHKEYIIKWKIRLEKAEKLRNKHIIE